MRFLSLTALITLSAFVSQSTAQTSGCLDAATHPLLEDVIGCLETFTVPKDGFGTHCINGNETYHNAQPSTKQRLAWNAVFTSLLDLNGGCSSFTLPGSIAGLFAVTEYTERGAGAKSFCIVHEAVTIGTPPRFALGWGTIVVPAKRSDVARCVHFSAPHPISDQGTPQQAAALFKRTGAKSLLITGRHRASFPCPSCQGVEYHKTDAAHSIDQPFHEGLKSIRAWQNAHGGCQSASCAYIQMHAEGDNLCPNDCTDTFLSAGLGRGRPGETCSRDFYTHDSPVKHIRDELNAVFPTWKNHLPPDDACCLTATDNIFGRLVNAAPRDADDDVCTVETHCANVKGEFAHIEQKGASRDPVNYDGWARAISRAFATRSC